MKDLSSSIHNKVKALSKQGDAALNAKSYSTALGYFEDALSCLPKPISDWDAGLWLYTAIGDTYFAQEDFANSRIFFNKALVEYSLTDNPYLFLRLGQSEFELEMMDNAKNHLLDAYMLEGDNIFEGEDDKYFKLISSIV